MTDMATAGRLNQESQRLAALRERVRAATLRPEADASGEMLAELTGEQAALERARNRAARWVETARADRRSRPLLDRMLEQFPLDSAQGRALMSLAEALLRTPDPKRTDQLIAERLTALRGAGVPGDTDLLLRTGFTLLGAAGRLLPEVSAELSGEFSASSLTKPMVAPIVRAALRQSMQLLGQAFIVGETIDAALARGRSEPELALCSFDVLGEGARTDADAQRYFDAYHHAIEALGGQAAGSVHERSGISVKLSALEPRYTQLQSARVHERLAPKVLELARSAAHAGIGFTVDAEEADRLDLSLDIVETLARDPATRAWQGLGLAVQAYGRRAPLVLEWIAAVARDNGRRMTVRLVKGAYWDSEIKRAQERGLATFPVYTSKAATDASYLECARELLASSDVLYPQFATHNAYTVAAVLELAPPGAQYEFQRLHGMGEALYDAVRAEVPALAPVRVYAPVGTHEELLPYLVRRLLENGANSSFVHQFMNPLISVEEVVRDPLSSLSAASLREARVREPRDLYGEERANSEGEDFFDPAALATLEAEVRLYATETYAGGPVLSGRAIHDAATPVTSPADTRDVVGLSRDASSEEIRFGLQAAHEAQPEWDALPAARRAACLERAAELLQARRGQFLSLLVREAGKTLPDALAELREAVDFCRYYAARGRELFGAPQEMPGPTGERNTLSLHGRGVFVCISPWNFPLAIFTGQVAAALAAGNTVVAKPAPATPLIAHAMTRLLHEAGVPPAALQLTPADGPAFGEVALRHPALAGVAFTGSTATAATINRTLAARDGPIVPLIAETGGVNAMVVDSTALPEQVVDDVITSAFTSAGQRCSALRVLYVQEEIAERIIGMLIGAMRLLRIGPPRDPATDVGPVISEAARQRLARHAERMRAEAKLLYICELPADLAHAGHFFPPHLIELRRLDQLRTEEFGPILHVARYRSGELPQVLEAIRGTGYGLTLGVHSRLETVAGHLFRSLPVGNTYVNRNMIGAVVGVQPFGGQGLSGTGPKAGGPHYLLRFATERTLTINTAAIGGNVELLS
ncbi:MAG TPA: bifunctional proline dehydrogenase/L-glutamate gamma-semialdehyde dehydrogenase PutA [Steroidobacteraceae bacterium]|nr:bifunctional proline dehydrogenase/L-glutamate gamma-semialdehyde dehydrogenase PutA [Steroidobacteraceae bacterium]